MIGIIVFLSCSVQAIIDAKTGSKSVSKPNIILLVGPSPYWGGRETHRLNLYKTFLAHGYNAMIVVDPASKGSLIEQKLQKEGLAYLTTEAFNDTYKLYCFLKKICQSMPAHLLICDLSNLKVAKRLKGDLGLKVLCEIIMPSISEYSFHLLDGVDGVLISSPFAYEQAKEYVKTRKINIPYIGRRAPFPAQEKFLTFSSQESRESFYKKNFTIDLLGVPVFCMIANMYANTMYKNHALLFQAVAKLVYEKNKPIEVMLAGDGVCRPILEKKVHDMKLERYVHFLGLTDKIPALLHFSDVHILTSSLEAFGAVYIEAGLMHRPSIGATETGAVEIIQDNQTGLLFENGDLNDLMNKIEFLLDHPEKRQLMGEQAFVYVMQNYSTEALFKKYQNMLDTLF